MENLSKMTIDDSCTSMYYSFNSTAANKTVETMESTGDLSCMVDAEDGEQNITLEADDKKDAVEQVQTIKKLSFGVSPMKAIPKNVLKAYMALSSTPTKAQLLRSVEVNRGSAAIGVGELGLAFLEAPQECINAILSEDKENQPQESQEIYSETSSENVVSVIEKTQEEQKPVEKKVIFSNLPVLKSFGNSNVRGTPKVRRSMPRCEPDLISNRPSRIATKGKTVNIKESNQPAKEFTAGGVPMIINSILKISNEMSTKRSFVNPEKPFNLIGKATRMSIVKTTLNSPARKLSRKSVSMAQGGRSSLRRSVLPINKRRSVAPDTAAAPHPPAVRRSVMPLNTRKSMLPTTITSPKKRMVPMSSRKSILPEKPTVIPSSRKSMVPKPSTSSTLEQRETNGKSTKIKLLCGLKEEYVCEVCSRKFRVLSLFEAHKKTHIAASATRQMCSGNDKQCRYCDKKFAIAKALNNHLIQNCTKIPPGDKKKLLFPPTLPVQPITQSNLKMSQKSHSILSSSDSLSSNATQYSRSQLDARNLDTGDGSMPAPSITKIKKKLAHSGVYCTPNKQIPCHVCKISFRNILAYTEHSLLHSTAANDDGNVSTTTEATQTTSEVKSDGTQTLLEDGVVALN